jgi:hypothetical protein
MNDEPVLLGPARERLLIEDDLTTDQRRLVLDQAQTLIDEVYVHRPHKAAMYGIVAGQQLRLLARRLDELRDGAFHYELLRILDGLRDMHTTYVLPRAYRKLALLGFVLERYYDECARPHYIVAKTSDDLCKGAQLGPGVEILFWNGMPIQAAVERNAEAEAGGNPAARLACGLASMTLRSLAQSPLPVEDWVELVCCYEGKQWTTTIEWKVVDEPDGLPLGRDERGRPEGRRLGISQRTETNRKTKVQYFGGGPVETPPGDGLEFEELDTSVFGDEVKARIVRYGGNAYGYLRIFTFHTAAFDEVDDFLAALRDLLGELPERGLIVDVRGNGGGYIRAAETLLRYLSDRTIQPEPMQFISSDTTYQLCRRLPALGPWRSSLAESAETGEQYSAALPLDSPAEVNAGGRAYRGEQVLLVTDALSYSATDMFAAGFQDNGIGPVLGVDDNTGAGGANRWTLDDLVTVWPDGPFRPLPKDSRMSVALRRSLRIGAQSGRPVEDLGVRPDVRYRMTQGDLLGQNRGLVKRAIQVIESEWVRSAARD